jgi:hypothetical protein
MTFASGTLLRRSDYLIPCSHNLSCSQPHTHIARCSSYSQGFLLYFCAEVITYRSALTLSTLN